MPGFLDRGPHTERYIRRSTDAGISTALFSVIEKSNGPEKSKPVVRTFVDRGEELVYVIVAGLLLVAAVVTCGFAAFSAAQTTRDIRRAQSIHPMS